MSDLFRQTPDMERSLLDLLAQVPQGKVTTYGDLARALGNVVASRWVGHHLRNHAHRAECVCHRVVRAGGELGVYVSGDAADKLRLLRAEGVEVHDGSVDLARFGFDDFQSDKPLARLKAVQDKLHEQLSLTNKIEQPQWIAGVDVSYVGPNEAVGAYALLDAKANELVWSTTVRRKALFPYITSYLAFRELPILLDLLDAARGRHEIADVVMVDGSGIMHPRGAGIASHLGIVANVPTIGVTKKLLCGKVDLDDMQQGELRPVTDGERTLGVAIRHRRQSARPLFVSPGHMIDVQTAAAVTQRLTTSHRLPEPIYWADRLSRQQAKTAEPLGF